MAPRANAKGKGIEQLVPMFLAEASHIKINIVSEYPTLPKFQRRFFISTFFLLISLGEWCFSL